MKKLLSLLFTAAIVFSLTMPAFAQDTSSQSTESTSKMKKTKATKAKKTHKAKGTKDTGTGR